MKAVMKVWVRYNAIIRDWLNDHKFVQKKSAPYSWIIPLRVSSKFDGCHAFEVWEEVKGRSGRVGETEIHAKSQRRFIVEREKQHHFVRRFPGFARLSW